MNEIQSMKDIEYARSLGYDVDIFGINDDSEDYFESEYERLTYEMTHRFDYEKKTKEYLESMY